MLVAAIQNVIGGCEHVGVFVDEATDAAEVAPQRSEVVRPRIVADSVDAFDRDESLREFTVLLKDERIVKVRGHALRREPHSVAGQDVFSVVIRTATEELFVAFFKSEEISGIFHGDLGSNRRIA